MRQLRYGKRVVVAGGGETQCNQMLTPICRYFEAAGVHIVIMCLLPEASSFPSGENASELTS